MRRVQQWNVYSASPLCVPVANQVWKSTHSFLLIIYRGFLKWWVSPTNPWGFPTKNDHFGVFWGKKHHFFGNTLTWKFAKRPLVFSVWSDSRSIKVNDTFLQCVSPAVGSWVVFFFRRGRSSWTTAPNTTWRIIPPTKWLRIRNPHGVQPWSEFGHLEGVP